MWENMAVPRGQESPDRTWQTSSRMRSVRQEAPPPTQPPRLAFLTQEAGHKSWLPPRPALGPPSSTTWGPRFWHPPNREWWANPSRMVGFFQ